MRIHLLLACFLLPSLAALVQTTHPMIPQAVEFHSGRLHLNVYLWIGPFFVKHGYAFFYPFRRGHGPSADH